MALHSIGWVHKRIFYTNLICRYWGAEASRPEYFNFSIVTFDGFSNVIIICIVADGVRESTNATKECQSLCGKLSYIFRVIFTSVLVLMHFYWHHFQKNKRRNSLQINSSMRKIGMNISERALFQVVKRSRSENQYSLPFISAWRHAGNIQFLRTHFMEDKTHESEVHMWKRKESRCVSLKNLLSRGGTRVEFPVWYESSLLALRWCIFLFLPSRRFLTGLSSRRLPPIS